MTQALAISEHPDWAKARRAAIENLEQECDRDVVNYLCRGVISDERRAEFYDRMRMRRASIVTIENDPNWLPDRPPRRMPTAKAVALYWQRCGEPFSVNMDDPSCFGCKISVDDWRDLERAHLEDRFLGGLDHAANLVMLCRSCHRIMPMFEPGTHQQAIEWVLADPMMELVNYVLVNAKNAPTD